MGRYAEAVGEFGEALRLDPGAADVHNNLGGVLAEAGRLPEARAQFEEALRLKPDYAEARDNLERVRSLERAGGRP
jgi:Flp pilus assembly protein TadD